MMTCRYWRKRIPEWVYGDLDAGTRRRLERHLVRCRGCSGLATRMSSAVRKMAVRPAPDRPAKYWEGYWDRLEARMAREPEPSLERRPFRVPAWAYGAAGAVLFVALGIFLGRTIFQPRLGRPLTGSAISTGTTPPGSSSGPPAALPAAVSASRYLKRSRVLILAVVNSSPLDEDAFRLNLPLQKRTSAALLQEAAVLKKGLGSPDRRLEELLSDLERVLLQIANLAPDAGVSDIEVIRAGVEDRDLLFKINLSEIRRPDGRIKRGPSLGSGPGGPALDGIGLSAKA